MAKRKKKTLRALTPEQISEAEMKKFRAQQDMSTLRQAEEVKADRERLRAAQALAKEEQRALDKVIRQRKRVPKKKAGK